MPFTLTDVAPTRAVNGKPVSLTDEDRQAIADEWNAEESKAAQRQQDEAREAKIRARIDRNARNQAIAELTSEGEI